MTQAAKEVQPVHALTGKGQEVKCGHMIVGGDRITDRTEDVTCEACLGPS